MNQKSTFEQLESANWNILAEMVAAGYNSDAAQLKRGAQRLEDEVPVDRTAGRFIYYLLWRQITLIYGPESAIDLDEVAGDVESKVSRVVDVDRDRIVQIISTGLGLLDKEQMASEADLIGVGTVILGCLLEVFPGDLDILKPGLMKWYHKNYSH